MSNQIVDLISISLRKYEETHYGFRHLGPYRYAFDLGFYSIVVELWLFR